MLLLGGMRVGILLLVFRYHWPMIGNQCHGFNGSGGVGGVLGRSS